MVKIFLIKIVKYYIHLYLTLFILAELLTENIRLFIHLLLFLFQIFVIFYYRKIEIKTSIFVLLLLTVLIPIFRSYIIGIVTISYFIFLITNIFVLFLFVSCLVRNYGNKFVLKSFSNSLYIYVALNFIFCSLSKTY